MLKTVPRIRSYLADHKLTPTLPQYLLSTEDGDDAPTAMAGTPHLRGQSTTGTWCRFNTATPFLHSLWLALTEATGSVRAQCCLSPAKAQTKIWGLHTLVDAFTRTALPAHQRCDTQPECNKLCLVRINADLYLNICVSSDCKHVSSNTRGPILLKPPHRNLITPSTSKPTGPKEILTLSLPPPIFKL